MSDSQGRPPVVAPRGRPTRPTSLRSGTAPEVRLPPPPSDRLPEPREVRQPDREDVPMEVQRVVRARTPQDLPVSELPPDDSPARRGPSSRELLRQALATPAAARQGFLLREALGPPVSLRTDRNDRPT